MALKNTSPYELGATLYMPILKPDALEYIAGTKVPKLRSMVLCLEDALLETHVLEGLDTLEKTLIRIGQVKAEAEDKHFPLVFVRPRNLEMAKRIAQMAGIHNIDGFVAPKVRPGDHEHWVTSVRDTDLYIMPTLETLEAFDVGAMTALRDEFLANAPDRILALRVGGNDLMSCLGLRRVGNTTLYEGPLLYAISMLMSVMKSKGFDLTAPVFEIIDDMKTLLQEVTRDVNFGFVGKTIIHPDQIDVVQNAFRVPEVDIEAAKKILDVDAPAVFKFGGSMCEPATHRSWAQRILSRASIYGIVPSEPQPSSDLVDTVPPRALD
ncbi:HpcH/HpaI aldolase/citrate lyase family protein [Rhizobium leguminosarum]|uniref:HpcH/HpaI aldolase/citrate lyase family protein n=1 Tax=Rhizobium leguminosarum TaxID=384 RepID=UPI0004AFC590|nr:HpcH/HpaI aldolase/citrate lyase family protein [Rhizobium leguminosarum]WFT86871.1 HpcH/HpaI aldolase/citrate lyase family protein [Rhizobium leguminosarum]